MVTSHMCASHTCSQAEMGNFKCFLVNLVHLHNTKILTPAELSKQILYRLNLEVTDICVQAMDPCTQSTLETVWPDVKSDFLKAQSYQEYMQALGTWFGLMN